MYVCMYVCTGLFYYWQRNGGGGDDDDDDDEMLSLWHKHFIARWHWSWELAATLPV